MPTYEYRCQDCGSTVEVVQSFKDEPLTVCGVCGGRLRRVFHPVGIVLKGSGFYSTDNRSSKKPVPAKPKDDKAASSSESTSSSGSSKSKSEAKSDAGAKKSGSGGDSSGSSARAS
jgi:putative FmdB family regulatory protein